LVTPGLVFQLIRESQRPALQESAFREASRVALTSLVFSAAATLFLGLLTLEWPNAFADVPAWLDTGEKYASSNLGLVVWTISAEVALAAGLAGAAALLVDRLPIGSGAISKSSVWHKHFAVDLPAGHAPWLKLTLEDGTRVWGWLDYYTVDKPLADREISLKGPGLALQMPGDSERIAMSHTDYLQLRGSTIRLLQVMHRRSVTAPPEAE
jgi:hypothetical protein